MRKLGFLLLPVLIIIIAASCKPKPSGETLIIEIPPGFSGNFMLEMGVKGAPELPKDSTAYTLALPKSGRVVTSTLLMNPQVSFRNLSDGAVWGYSHSLVSTGDGISVGGKIEFFVGTKQDFDAQENKKNHSGSFASSSELMIAAL